MDFVQAHIPELGLTVTYQAMRFDERNGFSRKMRRADKFAQSDVIATFLNEHVATLRDAEGKDVWEKGKPSQLDGETVYDGGWIGAQQDDNAIALLLNAIMSPGEAAPDPLAAPTGESSMT